MSATLDRFAVIVPAGTEKRKLEMCADCGYFKAPCVCKLGYRTYITRKPCRQGIHWKDLAESKRRWSW